MCWRYFSACCGVVAQAMGVAVCVRASEIIEGAKPGFLDYFLGSLVG